VGRRNAFYNWVCLCALLVPLSTASADSNKTNQRIDDLFVWMVSEKLQLKPNVEGEFASVFKELSKRKQELSEKAEEQIESILKQPNPDRRKKMIEEYRGTLVELGQIQVQEVERFSKVLGDEKFVQYLAAKQELGKKIRTLVSPKN
jgi:hypothetical protein